MATMQKSVNKVKSLQVKGNFYKLYNKLDVFFPPH